MEMFNVSFTLDQDTKDFLENQKWVLRKSKSLILRLIVKYFKENPQDLQRIIEGDNGE
ncbi:MAG: hypothetical protein ACFFDF_24875 [Candidatus Odinarchaeota archaeon]